MHNTSKTMRSGQPIRVGIESTFAEFLNKDVDRWNIAAVVRFSASRVQPSAGTGRESATGTRTEATARTGRKPAARTSGSSTAGAGAEAATGTGGAIAWPTVVLRHDRHSIGVD